MQKISDSDDLPLNGQSLPASAVGLTDTARATRGMSRRRAGLLLTSLAASSFAGWPIARARAGLSESAPSLTPEAGRALFEEAASEVLPEEGFQSRISLQDSILKLVSEGVIDPERFATTYADRGRMAAELEYRLIWPSLLPIHLTLDNAVHYVNLLWPLGLSNYMATNATSPVNGKSLFSFASTAGWTLGHEENGGAYFNRFRIVDLTSEQEALVTRVAESTFRPCCNNSTFFQDCNHGSALLGLLQLGASQGLTEDELYEEALAFNSFWFPQIYMQTALYFKVLENKDWADLDPKLLMGANYSAIGPWQETVGKQLAAIPNLLPAQEGGVNCGA